MYIAGIDPHFGLSRLPLSHNQGVEAIVWLTTVAGIGSAFRQAREASKQAKDAGPANTTSLTPFQKALTPIHVLSFWGPVAAYVIGTALNRFEQPDWFSDWELPRGDLSVGWHAGLRTLACVLGVGSNCFLSQAFKHLGSQWHFIGVREKPKLVQTGPYSIVRHPIYTAILISQASYALMWWNSIPLIGLVVTATAFAFKIPVEERLREQDPLAGPEYTAYKAKVTSRIIPGIW